MIFTLIYRGIPATGRFMSVADLEVVPLQRLILAYANAGSRTRFAFLFAFDNRLADALRGSTEVLITQMKLIWWRDVISMPVSDRPSGEPLVSALNSLALSSGEQQQLLSLIDGWEMLLNEFPLQEQELGKYSICRGESYFGFGLQKPLDDAQKRAAQSWALWDFARNCSDDQTRNLAFEKAAKILNATPKPRFDRSGRPLSILCKLIERDVSSGVLSEDIYRPGTAMKIMWHGITGL